MAKMGFRKLNDMIGRCDLLEPAEPLNAKVKVSEFDIHKPSCVFTLHSFYFGYFLANLMLENMQESETYFSVF